MEILAFPYAFGSANIYSDLKNSLGKKCDFYAFDYPGHGSRIEETPLNSIDTIADDAIQQISSYISKPYCLLGYSMGGNVVFEIYQHLKKAGKPLPKYIFILASGEPNYEHDQFEFEKYDLEQVKGVLRDKNGTSEEILSEDELIDLLSPSIIADSVALRDYDPCSEDKQPVECGVTIVRGKQEESLEHCKENWENYLKRKAEYILVDGKHFFLFQGTDDVKKKVTSIISERLDILQ